MENYFYSIRIYMKCVHVLSKRARVSQSKWFGGFTQYSGKFPAAGQDDMSRVPPCPVQMMNCCWPWDLERSFPGYPEFDVADNILGVVNNQVGQLLAFYLLVIGS